MFVLIYKTMYNYEGGHIQICSYANGPNDQTTTNTNKVFVIKFHSSS